MNVDKGNHLERYKGNAEKRAEEIEIGQRSRSPDERAEKRLPAFVVIVDLDAECFSRHPELKVECCVEIKKWGDVKMFHLTLPEHSLPKAVACEQIWFQLAECISDFGNGTHGIALFIETKVERYGIENIPYRAQIGQQIDLSVADIDPRGFQVFRDIFLDGRLMQC